MVILTLLKFLTNFLHICLAFFLKFNLSDYEPSVADLLTTATWLLTIFPQIIPNRVLLD